MEHFCTDPTCWICGEPDELRRMRHAIAKAMLNRNEFGIPFTQCSKLARIAVEAIRADVAAMMHAATDIQEEGE